MESPVKIRQRTRQLYLYAQPKVSNSFPRTIRSQFPIIFPPLLLGLCCLTQNRFKPTSFGISSGMLPELRDFGGGTINNVFGGL